MPRVAVVAVNHVGLWLAGVVNVNNPSSGRVSSVRVRLRSVVTGRTGRVWTSPTLDAERVGAAIREESAVEGANVSPAGEPR